MKNEEIYNTLVRYVDSDLGFFFRDTTYRNHLKLVYWSSDSKKGIKTDTRANLEPTLPFTIVSRIFCL